MQILLENQVLFDLLQILLFSLQPNYFLSYAGDQQREVFPL